MQSTTRSHVRRNSHFKFHGGAIIKAGRNEPCPCGSGKKFKKCCLEKSQAEYHANFEAQQRATALLNAESKVLTESETNPPRALPTSVKRTEPAAASDPHEIALVERWEEFQRQDQAGQIKLFIKTVYERELMDEEMAFEMLSKINESGIKSNNRDSFEGLVDLLRTHLPEVYHHDRSYYLKCLLDNAAVAGRSEKVIELSREIAESAGDEIDNFARAVELLAYHGQLKALSHASRIAWPLIKSSVSIMWGTEIYSDWGMNCSLFERLEVTPELDAQDPQLIEEIRFYDDDFDLDEFRQYVSHLTGTANRVWSLDDFQLKPMSPSIDEDEVWDEDEDWEDDFEEGDGEEIFEDDDEDEAEFDPALDAFFSLFDEFVNYVHRNENVPYTKAILARSGIAAYLLDRHRGDLEPTTRSQRPNYQPSEKQTPKPRQPMHLLYPDCETLERFLASKCNLFSHQLYVVASTFELIPSWLRFLESKGLIESSGRNAVMSELSKLKAKLVNLFAQQATDPSIAENLGDWPRNTPSVNVLKN